MDDDDIRPTFIETEMKPPEKYHQQIQSKDPIFHSLHLKCHILWIDS